MTKIIADRPDIVAARTVQSLIGLDSFIEMMALIPVKFFKLDNQDKFIFWFEILRAINKSKNTIGPVSIEWSEIFDKIYHTEKPEFPHGEFNNGYHYKGS